VAFGVGVHFCLGAPLARMELTESVAHLFTAYPDLALAGEPESRGTFVLRGYRSVPVRTGG
jgi:unspecific monooxygenase